MGTLGPCHAPAERPWCSRSPQLCPVVKGRAHHSYLATARPLNLIRSLGAALRGDKTSQALHNAHIPPFPQREFKFPPSSTAYELWGGRCNPCARPLLSQTGSGHPTFSVAGGTQCDEPAAATGRRSGGSVTGLFSALQSRHTRPSANRKLLLMKMECLVNRNLVLKMAEQEHTYLKKKSEFTLYRATT